MSEITETINRYSEKIEKSIMEDKWSDIYEFINAQIKIIKENPKEDPNKEYISALKNAEAIHKKCLEKAQEKKGDIKSMIVALNQRKKMSDAYKNS